MSLFPPRLIVCSKLKEESLKKKYPTRHVISSEYCPNREFYYFNKKMDMRIVNISDGSVWISTKEKCAIIGRYIPDGFIRRVR